MTMKILLVQPHNVIRDVINLKGTEIPLNLLYLATAIIEYKRYLNAYDDKELLYAFSEQNKFHWQVEILDLQLSENPLRNFKSKLQNYQPDIVGFTGLTVQTNNVKILAKFTKNYNRNILTLFGGIHASALPNRSLIEMSDIDLIVIGEGEITLIEICRKFQENFDFFTEFGLNAFIKQKLGPIRGIAYRDGKDIIITDMRQLIQNINALPFPNRDLIRNGKYNPIFVNYYKKPTTGILSSRGCPFNCSYCSKAVYHRVFRQRSPQNVIEEMEFLESKYGITDFRFYDDTLTMNRIWMKKFCHMLIKKGKKYRWNAFSRVDTINLDMLKIMKAAGCYHLKFGIESYSKEILQKVNKNYSRIHAIKVIREALLLGIEVQANFILNFPEETKESIQKTIDFSKFLNPTFAMFFILKPLPGSQIYMEAEKNNLLIHNNWELYGEEDPPILHTQLNQKEAQQLLRNAYNQFYLRPSYIFSRIREIIKHFSIQKILRYFKGFIAFLPSKK